MLWYKYAVELLSSLAHRQYFYQKCYRHYAISETPNAKGDGNGNSRDSKGDNSNGSSTKNDSSKNESSKESASKTQASSKTAAPKQTTFPADTSNFVRLKCREMLAAALKTDGKHFSINLFVQFNLTHILWLF